MVILATDWPNIGETSKEKGRLGPAGPQHHTITKLGTDTREWNSLHSPVMAETSPHHPVMVASPAALRPSALHRDLTCTHRPADGAA